MHGHIDPTREVFQVFKDLPRTGPIHMLNLIRLRKRAVYPDGKDVSGAEAYRAYGRDSHPIFARVGGVVVWQGAFDMTLIGPSDERWDIAFIAQYPSADAFIAMLRDPIYREAVKHRQVAVDDSRLVRLKPQKPGRYFGETAK